MLLKKRVAPRFVANAVKRVDPTKTVVLRARFSREMRTRFATLRKRVHTAIVTENGFGLIANKTGTFAFTRTADKHASFMEWLKRAEEQDILSTRPGTPFRQAANDSWMNTYVDTAYQRGIRQAGDAMNKAGGSVSDRWIDTAFNRPIHADNIALLYTRNFNELVGITDAMDKSISRTLAEGFASGKSMLEIASDIEDAIDGIGRTRAETLARTEIISAHAEGSLNSYEEAGLEGVSVDAEFATADDEAVCPECDGMQGDVIPIAEARGVIPVHPNCRCAWLPVVNDPESIDLQ